jgi:hypothetical protein
VLPDVSLKALRDLVEVVAGMCERPPHCVRVFASVPRPGARLVVSLEVVLGDPTAKPRAPRARGEGESLEMAVLSLMRDVRRRTTPRRPEDRCVPQSPLAELDAVPRHLRGAYVQVVMAGDRDKLRDLRGDALDVYAREHTRELGHPVDALIELAAWLAAASS